MASVNTYLTFNGNCEEAFNFYKSVIGGDFTHVGKFKEMPENPEHKMLEEEGEKIMHISYPIGNSILMGSDTGGEWSANFNKVIIFLFLLMQIVESMLIIYLLDFLLQDK